MRRLFLNSEIKYSCNCSSADVNAIFLNRYIIQVEELAGGVLVEFCEKEEILELIPFVAGNMANMAKSQPVGDIEKVNEFRETIINKDPFMIYSDCPIGKVFDDKNEKWISRCLKEMKNEYIRDRVEYLVKYYKSRGETWIN